MCNEAELVTDFKYFHFRDTREMTAPPGKLIALKVLNGAQRDNFMITEHGIVSDVLSTIRRYNNSKLLFKRNTQPNLTPTGTGQIIDLRAFEKLFGTVKTLLAARGNDVIGLKHVFSHSFLRILPT